VRSGTIDVGETRGRPRRRSTRGPSPTRMMASAPCAEAPLPGWSGRGSARPMLRRSWRGSGTSRECSPTCAGSGFISSTEPRAPNTPGLHREPRSEDRGSPDSTDAHGGPRPRPGDSGPVRARWPSARGRRDEERRPAPRGELGAGGLQSSYRTAKIIGQPLPVPSLHEIENTPGLHVRHHQAHTHLAGRMRFPPTRGSSERWRRFQGLRSGQTPRLLRGSPSCCALQLMPPMLRSGLHRMGTSVKQPIVSPTLIRQCFARD